MGLCTSTPQKFVKRFNRLTSEDRREVLRLLKQISDVNIDGFTKDSADKCINTVSGLVESAPITPTPCLEYRPFEKLRLHGDPLSYPTGLYSSNETASLEADRTAPTIPEVMPEAVDIIPENQSERPNVVDVKSVASNSNPSKPEPDAKSETHSGLSGCTFTIPLEFQGFMVETYWNSQKRTSPRQADEPPEVKNSSRTFPTMAEKTQLVQSWLENQRLECPEEYPCNLTTTASEVTCEGSKPESGLFPSRYEDGSMHVTLCSRKLCCNHPMQHNRSCIHTLYLRIETHRSTPAAKRDEMKLLRELFAANGYPRTFIERNLMTPITRNEESCQPKSWRSIPLTLTIRQHMMLPKDPIPNREKSAVIYRLQCNYGICNYVGGTGQQLQTRMHEHHLTVRSFDQNSEVATPASQTGHVFNFDATEIVGRGDDCTSRQIKEAWMSTNSSVNRHINLPAPIWY
ncbi:unnamed protein product [Schistocephalus solidus]|uniref:Helix-turn-helix domain-containing protein n=1 Tax=Schistocephalus solidus TaxID=70667 RepID=A0A183TF03_SCHSO|nr:unnamed protein product [Schistocephalus solidus]